MTDLRARALLSALFMSVAGCGGGGGGGGGADGGMGAPIAYAHSVALGSWIGESIDYIASQSTTPAGVTSSIASALLPTGATALVAEHVEASLPGVREVCVSGQGESTNVIAPINLGVIAQSAAVLLDAGWNPVGDRAGAWAAIAQRRAVLTGWENCGVKPEGAPSPSSLLTAQTDGGYAEDVYDGNPSTTFNVISQAVPAAQMAAMLSDSGLPTRGDPARPMRLYWRIYADGAGRQLLIEMGWPSAGAPRSLKGFIALYVLSA